MSEIELFYIMNKKVIGFICTSGSSGGLEMLMSNICLWLKQRGNDCIFICLEDSYISGFTKRNYIDNYEIKKPMKLFDFKTAIKIKKIIYNNNISTIISGDNRDLNLCYLVKKITNPKPKHIFIQNMQVGIKKKDFYHTKIYQGIDYWVSPLSWLRNQVLELTNINPEKVKIIPHGFDVNKFSEEKISKDDARKMFGMNPDKYYLGITGRIDVKKGQEFLIRAINYLNNAKCLNINLAIGGEPTQGEGMKYYNHLRKLTKEFNLENNILFLGFIENTSAFYKTLDAFVMASESETYGLVTLEAMASGVPVIGTDTGGTKEILQSGKLGYLYEPGNINQFCEIVEKIKNRFENIEEKVLKAKEIAVSKYSKEVQCEMLEKII